MSLEKLMIWGLSHLSPETAHNLAKFGMKRKIFSRGEFHILESETKLFDVMLPNSFGIAAGFDKYAELHDVVQDYGFAWIEEGSFTAGGGEGYPQPRLFRLEGGSLLNRMGLNCICAEEARARLEKAKNPYSFAVNISKTNNPDIAGDRAIDDILYSYNELKHLGIYTAINVSCPNTVDGKETFEQPEHFRELIAGFSLLKKGRPLVFKFSPGLVREVFRELVEISHDIADGYEVVNTFKTNHFKHGDGGVSGICLKNAALEKVRWLKEMTDKPVLGVGGISTGRDSYKLERAGANAFLVFTGFVNRHLSNPYAGPGFAYKIIEEHLHLRHKEKIEDEGLIVGVR